MEYKRIVAAILRTEGDYRPVLRAWVELFEDTDVDGFNRNEFLDEVVKQKKEEKK